MKRHSLLTLLTPLALGTALLFSCPGTVWAQAEEARVADPVQLILQGNGHYQEGRFQEALSTYESILESGFESPDLYYNLGNAYFKMGNLGGSILNFEKALSLRPRDADAQANLELAKSLTADEIQPLPRFWVLSVLSWWTEFLPRGGLIITVVLAYLFLATGLCVRVLSRGPKPRQLATWVMVGSGVALLSFGTTLLAREGFLGGSERGVIMVEEVAVQSAPSDEGDLTLFHVHEGTTVRLDQHTDEWSEIVLEDGRVGWVPSGTMEII